MIRLGSIYAPVWGLREDCDHEPVYIVNCKLFEDYMIESVNFDSVYIVNCLPFKDCMKIVTVNFDLIYIVICEL